MYKLIETEEKINIPQNSKDFYMIKKSEEWSNAIEIKFNPYTKINILNLYGILKSYLNNKKIKPISVAFSWSTNERKIVMDNIKTDIIERMDFIYFEYWFTNRMLYDKKYDNNEKFEYTIIIIFGNKSVTEFNKIFNKDILSLLKPKYPWNLKKVNLKKEIIKEILKNPKLRYMFIKNKKRLD